ncbi:hypothetical protein CC1G_06862 [Coprinopsis cinerea okayama7|uniref:HAD-like protein n=1 Tax=Coprinopsis cinerea (strain Okayama-7 / 130 / ATCC MYA-4618 / FGSC 9003) TaxID=240176 RepID=A8N6Z0_COPC7|nr:hypothetical protein CC1G_06862 [Coprinopsis cinerea okayama7\|eukprot:XP_001830596.1 hypothetical protein CC1G_06862 [Coprinopsis cinerea okayama7\
MVGSNHFSNIVFDLGDVLFTWSSDTKTCVSPRTLKAILSTPTWFDYERGLLSQEECYRRVSEEFDIPANDIALAFEQATASLRPDTEMFDLIRDLKEANPSLRLFAMSNISAPDWVMLEKTLDDWSMFEQIFTSAAAGERKPHLGFYRHVIRETGIEPRHTIFIDDKLENVLSARSLGFHGIQFDDRDKVKRALRNLLGDPVTRGRTYLAAHAKNHKSVTARTEKQPEVVLHENFAQLLILELTNDRDLVDLVEHDRTWNFFHGGKGQLTTEAFPFDIDTTSLGLTVMKRNFSTAHSVMDEMLQYVDSDGIIQTYFDHRRPRFDPVVCVNALTFFYTYGRGEELRKTLEWVSEVLLNRAYLDGTRYYMNAECFLYCFHRLLDCTDDEDIQRLRPLFTERVQERIGAEGDAMALAMRIIVCNYLGLHNEIDMRTLLALQCEDGGWEMGWIYKYGASGLKIGNRGLTTALAVDAIINFDRTKSRSASPSPSPTVVEEPIMPTLKKRQSIANFIRPKLSNTNLRVKLNNTVRRIFSNPKLRLSVHTPA